MPRPQGRPRKHWAQEARVYAWYSEIQRRCGWSNYELDYQFAWRDEHRPESRSTVDRPRIFDWIQKEGREPKGRDDRWRSLSELVIAVDQHPLFVGTRVLYESPIWDIFQEDAPRPDIVMGRVLKVMANNNLVHVHPDKLFAPGERFQDINEVTIFDRCVEISLREMSLIAGIEMVWSLHLLTEPTHKRQFRERLEFIIDRLLEHFFLDYFQDGALHLFYSFAIGTLQHSKLDFSERKHAGYGAIDMITDYPIAPKHVVEKMTVKKLLSVVIPI